MEYLQFGFAAVFCVLLYTDQRTIIKRFTTTTERLIISIEKALKCIDEKKAD